MSKVKLKVYSTSWCGYCHAEKAFLDKHKAEYEDVDVEADQAAAHEMVKLSGQMGVPFTVVTRSDGSTAGMVGFNQAWLEHELGLKS